MKEEEDLSEDEDEWEGLLGWGRASHFETAMQARVLLMDCNYEWLHTGKDIEVKEEEYVKALYTLTSSS